MALTRADFENDQLRRMLGSGYPDFAVLSDAELEASLAGMLAEQPAPGSIWIFGYGSLIWNPIFHHVEHRVAKLSGFHRRFCVWSRAYRGTPHQPGLVLGLDAGGACRGIAYRLDPAIALQELQLLWRREMVSNAYRPRWVRVSTACGAEGEDVHALTFVVNRGNPGYAGKVPIEKVIDVMRATRGHAGTPVEYLFETVKGLQAHGLRDAYLLEIKKRLLACGCKAGSQVDEKADEKAGSPAIPGGDTQAGPEAGIVRPVAPRSHQA